MKTVLQIIEEAGGLATFTWKRIENPPFMHLVIESLGEPGPNYFRNDYAGVERWNRQRVADGSMTCQPRATRDLESFMEMWDANIHDQGFLEAFQRTTGQRC